MPRHSAAAGNRAGASRASRNRSSEPEAMYRLHGDDGIERRMRDGRPNADIRLIEIDDTLRQIAAGGGEDFRLAYGVSLGGN